MITSPELNLLKNYFHQNDLNESATVDAITKKIISRKFVKNEFIFEQGKPLKHFFFLPKGVVRYFVLASDGKEHTKGFRIGPTVLGSIFSLSTKKEAPFSAQAMQDVTAFGIDINYWRELVQNNSAFAKFYMGMLEEIFIKKEKRELSLLSETPKKLYEDFQKEYSEYSNVIPQWVVASFLGMTPETLSRIRRRKK